ncbi:MAG: glycosyltransferase family 39 protein [Anaerolineae bacterium]|nr:glycosyltransferase family 39 protein [Anaerolineae bacterium]
MLLITLGAAYFLLQWVPCLWGTYGYFVDELYYLACSERLAAGYVDHPPLSILLLHLVRAGIGDSLPALRLVPAAAGSVLVVLVGFLARRLGAGTWGQGVAAAAVMVSPIYQIIFSFYSMNAFALLFWVACYWILLEIEQRNRPSLWLAVGVVAGLGLLNKHTMVLFAFGLAMGLIFSPARRHLRGRWLWFGLVSALVIVSPNLFWQAAHDWPSVEFYRNADAFKNVVTPAHQVLIQQVLFMNPAAFPIWVAGLVFLLRKPRDGRYRHLGWMFLALLALMLISQKSRPDRIAGGYIILFAGGGAALQGLVDRNGWGWIRWAIPALLLFCGLALAPLGLPILPPRATAAYVTRLGIDGQIERGEGMRAQLPQWFTVRLGWEEFVNDVEDAISEIGPAAPGEMIIFVPSYGHAGAIALFGRGRGLPPVYSWHNTYFLWGPPDDGTQEYLVVGIDAADMESVFGEFRLVRVHHCDWCMPWRDAMPIWIARDPVRSISQLWPELKMYR